MLSSSIVLAQRFVSITRRRTHLTAVYSSTRSPGINEIECYWRPKAFRTWNRIITWLKEMQTLRQIAAWFTERPHECGWTSRYHYFQLIEILNLPFLLCSGSGRSKT